MSAYQEQLARVARWLRRIESQGEDHVEYEDYLWSFFQNCWHLKDWIENDDTLPKSVQDTIEKKVKNYDSLMICADLANRSKHLQLTRKPHHDKDPRVVGKIGVDISDSMNTSESSSAVSWEYVITLDDGSSHLALDVARDAVTDWQKLLLSYGLKVLT